MSASPILRVLLAVAVFSPQSTGATLIRIPRRLSVLPTIGVKYVAVSLDLVPCCPIKI